MILTVTPNAAIDKSYRVEGFSLDRVHRPTGVRAVAGGKGINVARAYRALGGQVVTTGLRGGMNGRLIARGLAEEGFTDAFVRVRGESRLCIAIVDPVKKTQTEVNEPGPEVSAREVRALLQQVTILLRQQRFAFIVLNGSLPPGVPETLYAELIDIARREDTHAVLDASGAALIQALQARPWLVKPNRSELEALIGVRLDSTAAILDGARALHGSGIPVVAVTYGADGALLMAGSGAWTATPPRIPVVNPVASGDSFLAGLLWAWTYGKRPADPANALRCAVAAGAANAAVFEAAGFTRDAAAALVDRVEVQQVE